MIRYFSLFLQISWFLKTNNCPFYNKTIQDFAEFWKICGNFKAKAKTEDEGILKKRKKVILTVFAPPHYLSRVRRYSLLLLCEAPKCHVFITRRQGEGGTMSSLNLVSIYIWHHLSHQCQLNRLAPKLSGLHLDEQVVQGRVRSGPCMGKQPVLR